MEKPNKKQLEVQLIEEITRFLSKSNVKATQKIEKQIKSASKDLVKKLTKKIDQAELKATKLAKKQAELLKKPSVVTAAKKKTVRTKKVNSASRTIKRKNIKLPAAGRRKK